MPDLSSSLRRRRPARRARAARQRDSPARNWLIEAAYRMIQNNLDPEVAENPDALVVYGGIGKAARNWACFDAILDGAAHARRRRDAAGPVRQAGRRVPHPRRCAARADRQLEPGAEVGDLGALQRARPQGPDDVRPDDGRLAGSTSAARASCRAPTRPSSRPAASISAATSRAAGSSPPAWAAWAARSRWPRPSPAPRSLTIECQQSRIDFRLRIALPRRAGERPRRRARAHRAPHAQAKRAVSIGLLGNAAEIAARAGAARRRPAACGPTWSPTRPRRTTSSTATCRPAGRVAQWQAAQADPAQHAALRDAAAQSCATPRAGDARLPGDGHPDRRLRQQHPPGRLRRGRRRRLRLPGLRAGLHPAAVLPRQGAVPLGRAVGRPRGHPQDRREDEGAVPRRRRTCTAGSTWPASASPSRACRRASAGSAWASATAPAWPSTRWCKRAS